MLAFFGLFAFGLVLLVVGAEFIVRGGTRVAAQLGVTPMVIGLTFVAVGTSTPELAVGINAALQGNGALSVGNISGGNTINILFILGLSAMIRPLELRLLTLRFDLPAMLLAATLLLALVQDAVLSRSDGLVLVTVGILYTTTVVYLARRESRFTRAEFAQEFSDPPPGTPLRTAAKNFALLALGVAITIYGAGRFVDGAVGIARLLGVSDAFIGLTIVALGTSSPELVTTIVATIRDERAIAVGNLLGSSVYNILAILGTVCLVPDGGIPISENLIRIDLPVMLGVALLCIPIFATGRVVTRWEGALLTSTYVGYIAFLLATRL